MANYTELRRGDALPTVGVLQKLLKRTDPKIEVDGIFGKETHATVLAFQKSHPGLRTDGVVEEKTWTRLTSVDELSIVDCIDVFDPNLYEGDAKNVIRAGGKPLLMGGMSRGLPQAARDITTTAKNVFLLRLIGHGRAGLQGIADGKGGWDEFLPPRRPGRKPKAVWHSFGDQMSSLHILGARIIGQSGLQNIFGRYGSMELHGCNVGTGTQGHTLVRTLAQGLGVPVSAASGIGKRGEQISTFRFDGPVFTAFPGNCTLKNWCAALPDFAPLSVR